MNAKGARPMSDAEFEMMIKRGEAAMSEQVKHTTAPTTGAPRKSDSNQVHSPNHYKQFDKEVKDIIRFVLGDEGYKAYCQGNEIKYRLRAGFKDDHTVGAGQVDLEKALKYNSMRREVEENATPSDPS